MTRPAARRAAALAVGAWAIVAVAAPALEVPFLAGRVNDLADMLPAEVEGRLEARLERLENERGAQVAVLTIPTLEGEVLEDYSLRVAETWKLGRAEFDDGALLLIVRDDRKMRLEVGYGLEPAITDAASRRILDNIVRPRFREGDFAGGIEQGIDVVARLVEGEDALPPPSAERAARTRDGLGEIAAMVLGVGFFSLMAISARGCAAWAFFFILTPFWFSVPLAIWGHPFGVIPGILWMFGFPILWVLAGRVSKRGRRGGGGWSSSRGGWGGFSGGGFSGGGFSSGGFSGGGGSFGGGGSSSSW